MNEQSKTSKDRSAISENKMTMHDHLDTYIKHRHQLDTFYQEVIVCIDDIDTDDLIKKYTQSNIS